MGKSKRRKHDEHERVTVLMGHEPVFETAQKIPPYNLQSVCRVCGALVRERKEITFDLVVKERVFDRKIFGCLNGHDFLLWLANPGTRTRRLQNLYGKKAR